LLAFVEGPLWYTAVAIFVLGTAWRLAGMLARGGGRIEDAARGSPAAGAAVSALAYMLPRAAFLRSPNVQLVLVMGIAFHVALFAVLLFGAPHVAFIEQRILGIGWTALPDWAFVVLAEIAVAGLLVLWLRRAIDPVARTISRRDDHLAAGLTMAVMATGCAALGGGSEAMRALHMLSVDAWLIYFPFGSLFHAFTWIFARGYTGAMLARRGIRA
jgi:nitrate reductase gamma subunit